MNDGDERLLQLVRLERWLQRRYALTGWPKVLVILEDLALAIAIALVAVMISR